MEVHINWNDESSLKAAIINKLHCEFGTNLEEAAAELIYKACALVVRDKLLFKMAEANKRDKQDKNKKLYYLSMEFLLGRSLANNILNLMKTQTFQNVMRELGINPDQLIEYEPDAGAWQRRPWQVGSLFYGFPYHHGTTCGGCCIRYEYGLFKQLIHNGDQVEVPDWWLESGNVWEIRRPEEKVEVKFGGTVENIWMDGKLKVNYHDYKTIEAIPYDFPISGFDAKH